MNDVEKITNYQRKILYIQSSQYKYDILKKSIDYINNTINSIEFNFFNINKEIYDLFENDHYFYDFLENKFIQKDEDSNKYIGYNELVIKALPYQFLPSIIMDEQIYDKILLIYRKYFTNMSNFSIYKPIYDGFKIDTHNISNYLKVCYDEENFKKRYNIPFFYRLPVYKLSKSLVYQITTSMRLDTRDEIISNFNKDKLYLDGNSLNTLQNNLSTFVMKNIFKDINFNDYYKNDVLNSINIDKLNILYTQYIDTYIHSDNIILCTNKIINNFIQHYAYLLMSKYKDDLKLIKFDISNTDYYKKILTRIYEEKVSIFGRRFELESAVNIPFKFVDDYLQFINASLVSFNNWSDKLVENQLDNVDFKPILSSNEISSIIKSIIIDKQEYLNETKNNFMEEFVESNSIELGVYEYIGEIVDRFISTSEFKNFMLNEFIIELSESLKNRSPKVYKEIYENIDNLIHYIRFILVQLVVEQSNIISYLREIYKSVEIIDNFTEMHINNILNDFYNVNTVDIQDIDKDIIKFTVSIASLILLDNYIDKFRLNRKIK